MPHRSPEIIEVTFQQIEELLDRAESNTLREEDTELMRQIFESYIQFFEIVGDKNTTIARLRKLFFGASSEKTEKIVGYEEDPKEPNATDSEDADRGDGAATDEQRSPGHGRYGADDYPGANQVNVTHPTLCAGDDCPAMR